MLHKVIKLHQLSHYLFSVATPSGDRKPSRTLFQLPRKARKATNN